MGAALVSVWLALGHTTAAGERRGIWILVGVQEDSTRMNFAAQLFYSSYLSERLERLYAPRPALKESEENDPFWQRWEIVMWSHKKSPPLTSSAL